MTNCPPSNPCAEKFWELQYDVNIKPVIGAVSDYNDLTNKPSINGIVLSGDKTNEELLIQALTNEDIDSVLK